MAPPEFPLPPLILAKGSQEREKLRWRHTGTFEHKVGSYPLKSTPPYLYYEVVKLTGKNKTSEPNVLVVGLALPFISSDLGELISPLRASEPPSNK